MWRKKKIPSKDLTNKNERELLYGLYDCVDDLKDAISRLSEKVEELKTDHSQLRKFVYGNGEVGLVEKVRQIQTLKKIISWGVGILGALAIGLIFKIFTGEVSVVFK